MRLIVDVWVPGIPVTKGSVNVNRGGRGVRPAAQGMTVWSDAVRKRLFDATTSEDMRGVSVRHSGVERDEAAMIRCRFWVPRPGGADAYGGVWFPQARDGDKLERCTWDAVTEAGLWQDDAQVVEWAGSRRWASATRSPGAHITIHAINAAEVAADHAAEIQSETAYRRAMFGGVSG